MKNILSLPKIYKERAKIPPATWLTEQEYAKATLSLIPVCSDVVFVNSKKKEIYLAKRKAKPASYWWFLGGRIQYGEEFIKGLQRILFRETKQKFTANRFKLIGLNRYWFKNRNQQPQNLPADTLAFLFCAEIKTDEINKISKNLDLKEYDLKKGLKPFTKKDFTKISFHPAIVDAYKQLFSTTSIP